MMEDYTKLAPIVTRPEWDMFLVYITNLKSDVHRELEVCSQEHLKSLQGKLSVYNDILTLRQTVATILTVQNTKAQS